ncbi:hypothetical protein CLOM_g23776 [Closterium sp. NIES-68]|nr:hypothetical protein CLOM_g23776 [Closterium sp. NIES-68]
MREEEMLMEEELYLRRQMFEHIKDLVEADDSGPRAWKLLRDVIQPNTLPMVIVLEKELAAISMRPGDDVKPVLDKIKDTYARMAAAGSSVSQLQQCTKIISVRPEGWAPPGMKPPSGERAQGGAVQGSGAQGEGAQGNAYPGMFLMVEDVHWHEGDVGSVGKVVMHPLTHWVIDSGCTSHMTPRADLLDEVKPTGKINCRAKLGKKVLWSLEEETSCIKDLWQLPIIPWNGKTPTAATAAATKATAGGDATAPTDGVLEAFKKEQQTHGEVLAGVDASAAWAKASSKSGEADWETWHERLCHVNFPMLQKLVKDGSLKGLERKGEVAAAVLKEWMPRAQRECGHKVKVIRSDNGGEFIGADFEGELKRKGIQHHLTVPYNPQQNGVAERFNRTLQEGARTLLRPVNMLRAFGCMVVFHVPKEKRGKLEASGRWGVHLGIAKDHKGWLLWDLTTQKLTVLTYGGRGKPNVVQAGSVVEQIEEDEIAHCYWAPIPEPKTREEALNGPNGEKWKASEDEEFGSLIENETWDLCDLPPGKKAITSKMIYRHKYGPEGELTRYKSRLVARGFQQTKGKDYDEVFAPVGKGTTLRVLLAIAALLGWKIRQMDIVTAFLNGIILEEVYMKQPEGLDDGSGRVCRLKKAIYGLKQAPRAWYHKLEEALLARGFKKSECDPSLFLLQEKDEILRLLVYVDDILLFSASTALLDSAEQMLEMQFKCSKMGEVKYYLGMHVERDVEKGVLRLHQRKYCEGLAEKYGLQDGGKPATPLPSGFTVEPCADEEVVGDSDRKLFHSMVGSLNYAANHTRPDIAFATSRLASAVSRPSHEQLEAAKRLVRYVSATASVGLEYSGVRQQLQRGAADVKSGEMLLSCYTDASFNSVKADGTSIGGYVCLLGRGAMSWRSKKQNEVGLSSCETEYMALHHGAKEVVWLRRLLEELGVGQEEPTVVFCDNESAVKLAKNACLHGLTKHIRPKWHWVRRLLDKEVRLEIVKTHQQAAHIFTKRLAEADHWKGMRLAGMSVH